MTSQIKKYGRIIIKIGTNVITKEDGHLDIPRLQSLVSQIVSLKNAKRDVLVVTSGAIGAGMAKLGLKEKPIDMVLKQASAAVGQSSLMHYYEEFFSRYNQRTAQVLLTQDDLVDRTRRRNLLSILSALLGLDVIPVINENDVVSTQELAPTGEADEEWLNFSDNDMLSAAIACKLGVDLLIILTDVDGLFDRYPIDKRSKLIRHVRYIDRGVDALANGKSKKGRGGMLSKIRAARKAAENGVATVIANGCEDNILNSIIEGRGSYTFFSPKG